MTVPVSSQEYSYYKRINDLDADSRTSVKAFSGNTSYGTQLCPSQLGPNDQGDIWLLTFFSCLGQGFTRFLFISVSRSIRVQDWLGCWGRCYETMHGERRSNSSWNIILSVSEVVVLSGLPFNEDNQVAVREQSCRVDNKCCRSFSGGGSEDYCNDFVQGAGCSAH